MCFDIFQKMSDNRLTKCPNCKCKEQEKFYKVMYAPNLIMDSSQPKTVGDLAHRNTEKMVAEGKLPKSALSYEENRQKKRQHNKKMSDISKMTTKERIKYIAEGKK